MMYILEIVFLYGHKTAYDIRISNWSSDVCSSDLNHVRLHDQALRHIADLRLDGIGRPDREQRLMLLRRQLCFPRLGFAEPLKAPQRETKFRKRGITDVGQF